MSRLPYLTEADLDDEQRAVWDAVTAGRRGPSSRLVNAEGGLVGPFNAMLHSPKVGARIAALGETLRFDSSIERALLELAIITVGAHWRSSFEWWAHSRMAREAGVSAEIIDAVEHGTDPPFTDDAQATVHRFAAALVTTGRVDDATYDAAVALLGHPGVVELIALVGYYSLVSFTLNGFRIGVSEGAQAAWPD